MTSSNETNRHSDTITNDVISSPVEFLADEIEYTD